MLFKKSLVAIVFIIPVSTIAVTWKVGFSYKQKKITPVLEQASDGDTIFVHSGVYAEGNLTITKRLTIIGINYPVLDGEKKVEVVSIKHDSVVFSGFRVQRSGYATLDDPGGIKIYNSNYVTIIHNDLYDNFFGIYIQYGKHCRIEHNTIKAFGKDEQAIGNGIHCWKSDSILIIENTIQGHRDGIYFEFVTRSLIWRNQSEQNIRYGLHFMFSNHDHYITNTFNNNGAGVAVMFSHNVNMFNNTFSNNWGDAAYGILLKEISDCLMQGNTFTNNTTAVYMEGTNRIKISKCAFLSNGWGLKIQASCMDNIIDLNNFLNNTFDVSTNGSLVLNTFSNNYWDKYTGYDLNKDQIGDIPFHPLSLFAVLVEQNNPVILLYQSLFTVLLEKSEKLIPSLTPDNFIDNTPQIHKIEL